MPRIGAHINILGERVDTALPEGHAVAALAQRQRGEAFRHGVLDALPKGCCACIIAVLNAIPSASRRQQHDQKTSECHLNAFLGATACASASDTASSARQPESFDLGVTY